MRRSFPKSPAKGPPPAARETLEERTARLRALRLARDGTRPRGDASRQMPVLGLSDKMPFGKHAGQTMEQLIDEQPSYVRWLLENLRDFELSPEADAYWNAAGDPRRPRGV